MTIEYNVLQDGLRIETFPSGILDIHETLDYFERISNDNRIKPCSIEIVFFKNVTDFTISYQESNVITQKYKKPKLLNKIKATIFVCEDDLSFGIGRMLKTLHEITNPEHNVVVVRSENAIENAVKML